MFFSEKSKCLQDSLHQSLLNQFYQTNITIFIRGYFKKLNLWHYAEERGFDIPRYNIEYIPRILKSFYLIKKTSIQIRTASLWNRLPVEAITSKDVNTFKNCIDTENVRSLFHKRETFSCTSVRCVSVLFILLLLLIWKFFNKKKFDF